MWIDYFATWTRFAGVNRRLAPLGMNDHIHGLAGHLARMFQFRGALPGRDGQLWTLGFAVTVGHIVGEFGNNPKT